jgi:proline iminopeptidase
VRRTAQIGPGGFTKVRPCPPWRGARWGCALAGTLLLMACQTDSHTGDSGGMDEGEAFSEGLMPVNGTELYVTRMGAGPPVLVVHGGPLLDHGYLLPSLEPLSDAFDLVFFDQRLSGRSEGVVDSASVRVDNLVADMEGIRSALEMDQVDLLAHSWGGFLALQYALRHPDRVRRMVLVSPMAASAALRQEEEARLEGRMTEEYAEESRRLRADPGLQAGDTAAIATLLRHGFSLQFRDPALASALPLYVPPDYLERSRQFAHLAPDLVGFDLHPGLRELEIPVLLIYGEDEPGAELGGPALEAALPQARLVRIPAAGHFSFLERPELFLGRVRNFLEGG